ncbi:MAG TPA: prolyl oligopeptidase family serine peptidase [Terracidiphilus sp.]|nr:prolyl oligopeptidase family serine peptidase [Terracidiphilus sp.]
MRFRTWLVLPVCLAPALALSQSAKPTISLDEYLNTADISSARLAPDGTSAVIATDQPDWKNSVYRHDLWVWNAATGLRPLTHAGDEEDAEWSPDGKWIAFMSDRSLLGDDAAVDAEMGTDATKPKRVWIISAAGGEALPLYSEKLDAHTFAWSADSAAIYFSLQQPLDHEEAESRATEWQDVIRWREQNRGDLLVKIEIDPALANAIAAPLPNGAAAAKTAKGRADTISAPMLPTTASVLTKSTLAIDEIAVNPNGKSLAFMTGPVHHRIENPSDFEIYTLDANGGDARQLTHNQALESRITWAPDGRWLYFIVSAAAGSLEEPYRDVEGRLYRIDPDTAQSAKPERLGANFDGSFDQFALLPDGRELALGLKGVQTQLYLVEGDKATKLPGLAGTYAGLETAARSNRILVRHSTLNDPTQVYLAADPLHPDQLQALTNLNSIFSERAQPEWKPYTWTADDGHSVEGVLIFPPGMKDAKHLRMLTLIHGGPADADGDRFGADWYDWATLAADRGWLVFRPNYRGSTGYGDDFMLGIAPHLVSKPGRDILTGVDALVKDGYADPDHLAIGGYSYGGYMTNWLITQTTRFRSAVTGAGAVEHAANWGNDDETWDDAWYLGGQPWQNPELYQSEAALFRFDKVKTPTHLVQGGADVRVSYLEGVTMERALQALRVPHAFLVFPGEGHSLDKNPWHGYIKLREELNWLEKYDGK